MSDYHLVSILDAQKKLGLGKTYLYKILAEEEIPAVKIGKRTFIRNGDLNEFIQNLKPFKSRKISEYYPAGHPQQKGGTL